MQRFVFCMIAMLVSCAAATSAQAAAFGSSIFQIENLRLQYDVGGTWINATPAQLTVLASVTGSQSTATLGASTVSSGPTMGFDAPQSFVSPTLAAPAENTFTSYGSAGSYARADTSGSGVLVSPTALDLNTIAEVSSLGTLGGSALGNIANFSLFTVQANMTGSYRWAYDANVALEVVGAGAQAESDIRIQVNGGGDTGVNLANPLLNHIQSTPGTYTFSGSVFSPVFTLTAGAPLYQLTVNQTSRVSVAPGVAAVPEPGSMAVMGLLGLGTLIVRRRNRQTA